MTLDRFQRQGNCLIGVDVGGTKSAGGFLAMPDWEPLVRRVQPTSPERGGHAILDDVARLVRELQQEAADRGLHPLGVGVGVAELVDRQGCVVSEATVPWKGLDVGSQLEAETGLPVRLEADVRAAASAEARLGAGRGFGTFLYVVVGTGISACLIIDGSPYLGCRGLTGTFASSPGLIPDDKGRLVSGPSLEEFSAGPAIARRFAAVSPGFAGTAADVVALAESGDEASQQIVESAGRALGASLAHLVSVLDPEAVLLGGGLGLVEGRFRRSIDKALRANVWSEFHREIPILSSSLGTDAGWIGAALSAPYGLCATTESKESTDDQSARLSRY
jgi:glucokinase